VYVPLGATQAVVARGGVSRLLLAEGNARIWRTIPSGASAPGARRSVVRRATGSGSATTSVAPL